MPAARLTTRLVETFSAPDRGPVDLYDTDVRGLVLRTSPTGVKSWSFYYNFKARRRRVTLGQFPGLALAAAREKARELRGAVQRGDDPVADREAAEQEAKETGFTACKRDFIERYAKPKNKTWKEVERILDRLAVPVWGDRPVKEIRRRDVVDLIEREAAKHPHQANQLRAHLSKLFNWLVAREVLPFSPLNGPEKRKLAPPRDRVLSDEELSALWKASGELGGPYGAATRFIILTGLRKENVSSLRWDQVQGDWAVFAADEMKSGRPFRLPLSATAKAIIDAQDKLGDFVFTTTGKHGLSNWPRYKSKLETKMVEELKHAVPNWRLHDLRRTLGHGLARLGFSAEVRKRVLHHRPDSRDVTASVYTWHNFDDEARDALTKWSLHVRRLTTPLEVLSTHPAA